MAMLAHAITNSDRHVSGSCALAVAILCLAMTSTAAGQTTVEVGAVVGHYGPTGSFEPALVYTTALPRDPSNLAGAAIGGQVRLWVVRRFGLQVVGTTASSLVIGGVTPEGTAPNTRARVSTGTVQALYSLTGNRGRGRVWLGAGGAAVQHGGAAYAPYGSPVNFGGVAGVGSAFRIHGGLSAEAGITTMVYWMNLRSTRQGETGVEERGTQVDALFQTGLSWRWN
jgi:hypothetical protein